MITREELQQYTEYSPVTGLFTNLSVRLTSDGYLRTTIKSADYLIHRLAFLYMTGNIPKIVDHVNHNKTDNAWNNLRSVTQAQNMANRKPNGNRRYKGVFKDMNGPWIAIFKGKRIGKYTTELEAACAYDKVAIEHYGIDYVYLNVK